MLSVYADHDTAELLTPCTEKYEAQKSISPRENCLNCFDPKGKTLELYIQYKQWCPQAESSLFTLLL